MAGHMYNGRETELLIPASSLEVLKSTTTQIKSSKTSQKLWNASPIWADPG